jgi:hypothetical protein
MTRYPIFEGKMLLHPERGIYLKTTWYSDGSIEHDEVPEGLIINYTNQIDLLLFGTCIMEVIDDKEVKRINPHEIQKKACSN